jgi:acyl-CoA synthetase (AMP-forming)/AMP-acid ligase II/acyl carrier protein
MQEDSKSSIFEIIFKGPAKNHHSAIESIDRRPLTYGRLREHVASTVETMNSLGYGRNDRIAIVAPNGPEMAVAFLSVSAGFTSAPLNPAYRKEEFRHYLSDMNARAVIIHREAPVPAFEAADECGIDIIELIPQGEEAGIFVLSGKGRMSNSPTGFSESADRALVLHTSGTTSRPKLVPLTNANLSFSAYNIRDSLQLTEEDRCLNMMPLFHIHGLIGALLASLCAGSSIVCAPGFSSDTFMDLLQRLRPTWYTAVPTIHKKVLDLIESSNKEPFSSDLRFIRSSSAAIDPATWNGLEQAFQVPVIEAYGMTEASHQITTNPLPPLQRKPGSVGVGRGTHVAIMNQAGEILPRRENGEIVISGANVMAGYENNDEANEKAFQGQWLRTGDMGCMDDDGYIFIDGRLKEIINRGGEKISPREVEEAFLAHPSVQECVVFSVPNSFLGEEVGAALVLKKDSLAAGSELRHFITQRLAYFKVPRHMFFVDSIPRGATGKVQRIGMFERLGLSISSEAMESGEYSPPAAETEKVIVDIWREVLRIDKIGIHDNFIELGGDSIDAVKVISRIRAHFGVTVSINDFLECDDLASLAGLVDTTEG